jgi:Carboxypeptidase regulatory-like domain
MRTKKRKKRSGTSLIGTRLIGTRLIGTSVVLLAAVLLPVVAAAKKKPAPDTYAVISGSVFQESGYALPDAAVTLVAEPASGSAAVKPQKMEAVSDSRGEFIFRVPPGPMNYAIVVAAKGYQSSRKSVTVEGQERVEVTFQLDRESK